MTARVDAGWRHLLVFGVATYFYGGMVMLGAMLTGRDLLKITDFSLGKFYTLMGWVPWSFLTMALFFDGRYALLFAAAGVLGIVGELLVSVLWRRFFAQPIWTYSYRSILSGYTSTINFFPWAVGAMLFHLAARMLGGRPAQGDVPKAIVVTGVSVAIGVALSLALRHRTSARFGEFSREAFLVFCIPIALTAVALGAIVGVHYPGLMLAFGLVGFATEYAYGRGMTLFFERGLWTYNYWRIDGGHTSFVTLPLWSLGGLYFFFIAKLVGL